MRYKSREENVEAMQYTGVASVDMIAEFLSGRCRLAEEVSGTHRLLAFVALNQTHRPRRRTARIGDWIIKHDSQVEVLGDEAFHQKYQLIE